MDSLGFIRVAQSLEEVGLIWQPEIGDEVSQRDDKEHISILVDLRSFTPIELRNQFLWLPTVEQMVAQFEARKAILFHAGLEMSERAVCYKSVIQSPRGPIEATGDSLRVCFGLALKELLLGNDASSYH